MTPKSEPDGKPRYMTQAEVARELGYRSNGSVRNLIYARLLDGVQVSPKGGLRVTRESFERYCQEIERQAAERFGGSAA